MKGEDLEAIEKRAEAAKKGPWYAIADPENNDPEWPDDRCLGVGSTKDGIIPESKDDFEEEIIKTDSGVYPPDINTALFIAAARTDIPLLCAELRKAWKAAEYAVERWKACESEPVYKITKEQLLNPKILELVQKIEELEK